MPADPRFAGPASRMIEEIGQAFDMPAETWQGLALACEEVVAHVARHAEFGCPVTVVCRDGRHRMSLDVSLPAAGFDPRMFNITQSVRSDEEMDELGLLLAARMVDEFAFAHEGGRLRLRLTKSRPYPRLNMAGERPVTGVSASGWSLRQPSPDRLAWLCQLIAVSGKAPSFLAHPGRVIDMVGVGELDGVVAEDREGQVVGGALWYRAGQVVEFLGPYCLGEVSALAEALVEACLIAEARGPALGVICRHPGPGVPAGLFETIGALAPTSTAPGLPVLFRELREDPGATVWTLPAIDDFLRTTYAELGFARRILPPIASGEHVARHSVIATLTNREDGEAVLRPSLAGTDSGENIARHRRHLEEAGFTNLLCEVDLGQSWQVGFCPGLQAAGFEPRYVIPHGGESDVLVFQCATGGAA